MKKEKQYLYEMKPVELNILSMAFTVIIVAITYFLIKLFKIEVSVTSFELFLSLLILVPYFMLHEILHSIGYVVNGADFKRITYGIHLEKGVFCCSCKQEISKKTILWSLIYPFLFIGVITYILGFILKSPALVILSIANISGCSGDLIMFYDFLTIGDFKFFEYDNPLAFGLITKEDMDKKKMFGLKRIDNEKVVQTVDKKITVSKISIIILVLYMLLCLVDMFL